MGQMAGNQFEVLCIARENRGSSIVGLPSPDGSQDGVWYFPTSVLENSAPPTSERAAERAHTYRWDLSRQSDVAPQHDLGHLVRHRKYGYRGVVVGYDETCQQSAEWQATMGIDELACGAAQPFYHVLVDARDRPGDQVTYVAEENVQRPTAADTPSEAVQHRLVESMLLAESFDAQGRHAYEPAPALRALYPPGVQGCWMVDSVMPDGDEASTASSATASDADEDDFD